MVDWTRGDLMHRASVVFVDPLDLVTERNRIDGITGGSLNLEYYGDTRAGAKLTLLGQPWDGTAAMRIVHTVYDYTGVLLVETLFTGYVTGVEPSEDTTTYTLASTLHGMKTNIVESPVWLVAGSKANDTLSDVFRWISRPNRFENPADYLFGGTEIMEAGTATLEILHHVCDLGGNRADVDPYGIVTVSKYTAPSIKVPDFEADTRDLRGMVVGRPDYSDNGLQRPERVVVTAKQGDSVITACAVVPSGSPTSHAVRGYCIDSYHTETSLSPFTYDAAMALAQRYLKSELSLDYRCSHRLMYRPIRAGMIERLTDAGQTKRWMIQSAELDLKDFIWNLDLKGGWDD